ncbi:hypothetical protein [Streptomyces sp. CC224B]|uniref:hypothetical protein n=1 Tax=Streptomyces sp. CC224B TaxID=3044571 RepID=UPI0024A89BE0|nr:hypothetical protein [Streptomyces sp. CC224B]
MRGREAARAAGHKLAQAQEELADLRRQLAEEKQRHAEEVAALRGEIRGLKQDATSQAEQIAARALEEARAEAARASSARSAAEEALRAHQRGKDDLVYNTCRYLSMTRGVPPIKSLEIVIPWMTGRDYAGIENLKQMLADCGLPADGWTARLARPHERALRKVAKAGDHKTNTVVSLDHGLDQPDEITVHPRYNKSWYKPADAPTGSQQRARAANVTLRSQ